MGSVVCGSPYKVRSGAMGDVFRLFLRAVCLPPEDLVDLEDLCCEFGFLGVFSCGSRSSCVRILETRGDCQERRISGLAAHFHHLAQSQGLPTFTPDLTSLGRCRAIVIPSWAVVLGKSCLCDCEWLVSVVFQSGSRLERIDECAFSHSGLRSIVIPSSVVILGRSSFYACESLESVSFEDGSRLRQIGEGAFSQSRL
jgi:hypothetical protein